MDTLYHLPLLLLFCTTVHCSFLSGHYKQLCIPDPEVCMNASELITSKGYPCEEYTVQTKDGFLLGVQRIRHGRSARSTGSRGVVFLQHGLLCSSTNWITNLANESLGFILADAGYDVWMGNMRGNTYSRRHVKYSPEDAEFWAWSWDEMAAYDLPAMIDFALSRSNASRLHYVGHSQGTLIMFAHLADNPHFADKIKLFQALGPVATVADIKSPLSMLAYLSYEIQDLFRIFGVHEFLPNYEIIKILGSTVCDTFTRVLCEDVLFILAGFDRKQLNETRLPVYLSHTPAGTSVQNMVHFAQGVRSGAFQKYDYGDATENRKHYGQEVPPYYDPHNITAPVALYYAENDWLADVKDVERLIAQLQHPVMSDRIPDWNHLDFIWAMDAPTVLYNKMLQIMRAYDEKE